MKIIQGGASHDAIAKEIMRPFMAWLESNSCTMPKFCEAMRSCVSDSDGNFSELVSRALNINQEQFKAGIEHIKSLDLYAAIMNTTKEGLWSQFETNKLPAPQWLLRQIENAVKQEVVLNLSDLE